MEEKENNTILVSLTAPEKYQKVQHKTLALINNLKTIVLIQLQTINQTMYKIELLDRDDPKPFEVYTESNLVKINMSYPKEYSIFIDSEFYVTTCIALSLFQLHAYNQIDSKLIITNILTEDNFIDILWRGHYPSYLTSIRNELQRKDSKFIDAFDKIINLTTSEFGKLSSNFSRVISYLNYSNIQTDYFSGGLLEILFRSDLNKIKSMIDQFDEGNPDSWSSLWNLIQNSNYSKKNNVLRELSNQSDKFPDMTIYDRNEDEKETEVDSTDYETIRNDLPGLTSEDVSPKDSLGYEVYAEAIANLICKAKTETPITFGISAKWGQGKSTLLRYIEDSIQKNNLMTKPRNLLDRIESHLNRFYTWQENLPREEQEDCKFKYCQNINFNAWQYTKATQVWAEFYTLVMNEIENNLDFFPKFMIKWKFFWKAHRNKFIILLVVFILSITSIYIQLFSPKLYKNLSDAIEYLGWISSIFATSSIFTFFYKYSRSLSKDIIAKPFNLNLKEHTGIQHEIVSHFKIIENSLSKYGNKRIVVFIDEIDRCQSEKIVEIFEAMKLFLDINNFVFIVAMDTNIIIPALGHQYSFMCSDPHQRRSIGNSYLDKIIQVPFHLPELTTAQKKQLNKDLLSKYTKYIDGHVITPEAATAGASTVGPTVIIGESNETSKQKDPPVIEEETPEKEDKTKLDELFDLKDPEVKIIYSILGVKELDFSPRLHKRFINAYLIARYLFIKRQIKRGSSNEKHLPTGNFIKWLALSFIFPFEIKEAVKWINNNEDKSTNLVEYLHNKVNDINDASLKLNKDHSFFNNFTEENLINFHRAISKLEVDVNDVQESFDILNCFNFVLD